MYISLLVIHYTRSFRDNFEFDFKIVEFVRDMKFVINSASRSSEKKKSYVHYSGEVRERNGVLQIY